MGLQQFEGRLERLVDGTLSKAFRGELHPVEIGRRLTREMDLQRRLGVHGLIAPNAFTVYLSTSDFDRFESFLDALVRELEEAAREHARTEDYVFVGPVTVTVIEDTRQRRGRFTVVSEVEEGPVRPSGGVRRAGRRRAGRSGARAAHHRPATRECRHGHRPQRQPAPRRDPAGRETTWCVVDLNSTNGTRVNGADDTGAETGRRRPDRDRHHRPPIRDLVTAGS